MASPGNLPLPSVSRDAFQVGEPIGRGAFKDVFRGTFQGRDVAVLQVDGDLANLLQREVQLLSRIGRHPNLLRYLATCHCRDTAPPQLLLIAELAPHGSLKQLMDSAGPTALSADHIAVVLRQVCAGMDALAGAGIVHRDLAARNVLVFGFDARNPLKTSVKVSDFGLAASVYGRGYGTLEGGRLPFRWLAPEALKKRRFSEKSDVWAFGVLAWELLTDGDEPYANLASDQQVFDFVTGGGGLPRPAACTEGLWAVLQRCFARAPEDRPSFRDLAALLPAVSAPAGRVRCVICMEDVPADTAATCPAGHGVCPEHFQRYAASANDPDAAGGALDAEGRLLCPEPACRAAFDVQRLPRQLFEAADRARIQAVREKAATEARREAEEAARRERERINAIQDVTEREAALLRLRIVE